MFTGIIRDKGQVARIEKSFTAPARAGEASQVTHVQLEIATRLDARDLELGASVACNGACLTVTAFSTTGSMSLFHVEAGPETLRLSALADLVAGDLVNLEPALRMGDALGGHQVSGHLDALGTVIEIMPLDDAFWRMKVEVPKEFFGLLIPKGSIAVCGVSLTLAQVGNDPQRSWFEVMVIPFTWQHTTLGLKRPGSPVELEFDNFVKTLVKIYEKHSAR